MKLTVIAVFALLLFGVPYAAAQTPDTAEAIATTIAERATAYGVDPDWLISVAWCESKLDPFAIGAQGEVGLFQLHPRGKLVTFTRYYRDPWSVWEQSDFTAWQISIGQAAHWSCAR